jgi:PAS domain S-box-containing protein
MEIWTLWTPTYWLAGVIKAITAIASVSTAIFLIRLVPRALTIPTPLQLARAHEEALRRLEQQREADAKFRAIVEAAPDAMVIVNERGRIVLVNAETEQMFGYRRADLLDKSVETLIPERFRNLHIDHRAGYVGGTGARRIMADGRRLTGLRSDGTEFPAEITISPLKTSEGTLVAAAIRDVTERARAEQAVRRAKDEAETANAELEAFSYSVAHDLRTPLRSMSGYSTAVLDDYGDRLDATAKRHLTHIVTSAQRMSDIIDALLSLSRLTRIEPRREPVDLTEIGHAVIRQLRATDPARVVDFVADEGLLVHGDPQQLRLVLENLLGNAWKFTGKKPAARVELGCQHVDGTLAYYVRDNGAGFDMAAVDKLFAPFGRLHPQSEFAGTGIGLATVHRIVRRHGGRVWAEGAEAQGATFRFTLSPATTASGVGTT